MEISGLPLHPLVVHAAVVLGPVAALAALGYAAVGRWRDWLRVPMVVVALAAVASIVAAYLSGDSFLEAARWPRSPGSAPTRNGPSCCSG
jgi:uncharacterized membrane protein